MITAKAIKERIAEMCTHFTFEYKGIDCGIDPLCNPDKNIKFDMWFGDETYGAKTIDEVMNTPLFDGKCLNDIAEDIDIIDF